MMFITKVRHNETQKVNGNRIESCTFRYKGIDWHAIGSYHFGLNGAREYILTKPLERKCDQISQSFFYDFHMMMSMDIYIKKYAKKHCNEILKQRAKIIKAYK